MHVSLTSKAKVNILVKISDLILLDMIGFKESYENTVTEVILTDLLILNSLGNNESLCEI